MTYGEEHWSAIIDRFRKTDLLEFYVQKTLDTLECSGYCRRDTQRFGQLILTGPMKPKAGFPGERSSGGEVLSKVFRDCGAGTESVVLWP